MLSVSRRKLCSESLSASSSTVGSNCNLLVDILYCVPVKSLCVFKSVSKQWQSLISDPHFKRNYNLRRQPHSKPALFMKKSVVIEICPKESEFTTLVMDGRNCVDYVPFNPTAIHCSMPDIKFQQSCNGLLLYKVKDLVAPDGNYYHTTYVVYNPSMKHCKTLPSPLFRKSSNDYVEGATIAYDPAKSSYYEVVGVCITRKNMCRIEIYSSKTDAWREAGDTFHISKPGLLSCSGVYCSGSVHWMDRNSATLHYFEIERELMKTISIPSATYPIRDFYFGIDYFGECRGHIHLADLLEMRMDDMPHIDIWEMHTDYRGWYLKYKVDLSPLKTLYPRTKKYPCIIQDKGYYIDRFHLEVVLIEEDKDSSRLILLIGKDKVISYDLENKSFKKMYDVPKDMLVKGFEYMETLAH